MADKAYERVVLMHGGPTGVPQTATSLGLDTDGGIYVPSANGRSWVLDRTLGGGSTDFTAIASDVKPSDDDTYSLGSDSKRWKEGWIGGLHLDPNGGNPRIHLLADPNGTAQILVAGLGAQVSLTAADGDASHVGGELSLVAGDSEGQSGGNLNMASGNDRGGGDGGDVQLYSGRGHIEGDEGNGGSGGDISIRAGSGEISDWQGGNVFVSGGNALNSHGGHVDIQGGASTNGAKGHLTLYEGGFNYGIEIQPTALYFAQSSPPTVPATPTAQSIVDALVTLGLIAQSP